MRRIVFVEPESPNLHIFSRFALPRLGSIILATMMRDRGWEASVVAEELAKLDLDALRSADLIGISTITSTAPRAYAIADALRERNLTVIMGGPHVTELPEEALEHADFVIRGEGEEALMRFVDEWEGERFFARVPNLSYLREGIAVHNSIGLPPTRLDDLPFPDFSLLEGGLRSVAGMRTIPIQTSRGCPFDCSFCSVTGMFGRSYRHRSTANVIQELSRYDKPGNFIFFYDDNFSASPPRAKELLAAMIAEGFTFRWSTQVRSDVARDEELVELMRRAGCHTVFIGFESVNPESLAEMNKRQSVEDIGKAIRVLRRHKINIHGMFVHGFDMDDWPAVERSVRFAKRARLTSCQFLILTPLPGTRFYREMVEAGRLRDRDWSRYDSHHVVFAPKRLSAPELQWAQIYSHKRLYSVSATVGRLFQGRFISFALSIYARRLNRAWQRRNAPYLVAIGLIMSSVRELLRSDLRGRIRRRLSGSAPEAAPSGG